MSYLVLARKYRPQAFSDVIGQTDVTDKLQVALNSGRIAHAYLFCGPRGVGKTTCARILAQELNKLKPNDGLGLGLDLESSLDVIEIDAASNRGIDEIRTLRENVKFLPMSGRYKIYIIDEVHMLTNEAFNALLKTLEEPPEHVKFILATTDPNKLPLTVISRCHRCDFRRINLTLMVNHLKDICHKEKFTADSDALFSVARAAQGSLRDALSVLDQLSSTSTGRIDLGEVNQMLGYLETEKIFSIAEALLTLNGSGALKELDQALAGGKDIKQLTQDLIMFFRNLMIMKAGGVDLQDLIDHSAMYKKMLFDQSQKVAMPIVLSVIDHIVEAQEMSRITGSSHLSLEIAFIKIVMKLKDDTSNPEISAINKKQSVDAPPTSGSLLQNNRGSVSLQPLPLTLTKSYQANVVSAASLSLELVQSKWTALTSAVCRKKMSIGTYLQDGFPSEYSQGHLTILFCADCEFHKEFLDKPEHLNTISDAFQEIFGAQCVVSVVLGAAHKGKETVPVLDNALAMFGGKVVNEWHSDIPAETD